MLKKIPIHGFISKYSGLSNVLINEVGISLPFKPEENEKPVAPKTYKAIWDTGATNTVVSPKIVQECNLAPIGMTKVHTANGTVHNAPVYLISVFLPNQVVVPLLRVTEGNLTSGNADLLIGMDIMNQGDFTVSNFNGKTTFSFRTPSIEELNMTLPLKNQPLKKKPLVDLKKHSRHGKRRNH